jgi:3-phosphoinositide dependent protein kinase-1
VLTLQRDRHIVFEQPSKSPPPSGLALEEVPTPQDWLDALEKAREIALSQPLSNAYSAEEAFTLSSTLSSPSSTLMLNGQDRDSDSMSRGGLLKRPEGESKGKRFSKRVSKSGLSAVF